jgi:hypothetical protein
VAETSTPHETAPPEDVEPVATPGEPVSTPTAATGVVYTTAHIIPEGFGEKKSFKRLHREIEALVIGAP